MKIDQLCVRFPPAPGGAETHVYSISRELSNRGHDVRVFTSDLYREIPPARLKSWPPMIDGIPVYRFKGYSLGGELHYVFIPGLIPAVLKEENNIVHAHSYGYFHVGVAFLLRVLNGRPFVLTPHFHPEWSMWGGRKRRGMRRIYDRFIGREVLRKVDLVVGVSQHEIDLMKALGLDLSKVRLIPNGIDLKRFNPIPSGRLFRENFGVKERIVLFTGRLASNKGLPFFLDAAKEVLKKAKDVQFVLVGEDGGMREQLEEKARKIGIEKHVLITGHIVSDDLFLSAYGACDLFVLPSEYEAFGIVLLEAMACRKACVATRVGGVPEVVLDGETGVLVDYGDVNGLATTILELLENGERREAMGKKGRERVEEKFTWKRVVDELEKSYLELL